jgi:hypothetical protein
MNCFGALVISSVLVFFPVVAASQAQAESNGGICKYQRKQAMAAGRKGNKKAADRLWLEYRNCLRGRT